MSFPYSFAATAFRISRVKVTSVIESGDGGLGSRAGADASTELAWELSSLPTFVNSETVHEILQVIFSEFEANGLVEVIEK